MAFAAATQGGVSTGLSGTTFFPQNPVTTAAPGALTVSKPALASRVRGYASPDQEEGLIEKIIEAIRRFFARICRVFLPASSSANRVSDNSLQKPPTDALGLGDLSRPESEGMPSVAETDDEISLHGLPEPTLERIQETVDKLIHSVEGSGLSDSVRSALFMSEGDQRTTFRVLLQHNLSDTLKIRSETKALETDIESLISPYANEHGITTAQATALLRADLESGGTFIANRVDPNCEIRGRVAELLRLNSSLAGLAKARGEICTSAIDSGAYVREELGALIAQQGFDTEFLFKPEAAAAVPASQEKSNVVSLSEYKDGTVVGSSPAASSQQAMVKEAIRELEKQGVIEPDADAENKMVQAAAVDDVLSDEAEFETEMQGDDLGDFLLSRKASTPKPRI
ncbi:hypothetical protein IAG25_32575 [Caballeronia sp. EK]|uniref:hypothetical protein n=1 Tax=Caballeronia sp. EK TaxID=2767469 RepID=UPI001655FA39|nr:hypothetical protein [Caballeronia sp. EK]MBC8641560.1 hypothetical protein [Caballeronia sp. EK]